MDVGTDEQDVFAARRWPLVGRHEHVEQIVDALTRDTVDGVAIAGGAGVGKTRIAEECIEQAESAGFVCGRVTATPGVRGIALSALIPLLPVEVADTRFDPIALFTTVANALRARANGARYVVFVDDAHWLDSASAILLLQLVDAKVAFLVATVRAGEPVDDAIAALWRSDRIMRVDVDALAADAVGTLLHLVLGGAVDAAAVDLIASTSRGNVLFVRELVIGARAGGKLVAHGGVWRLTGPVTHTARLTELVADRLATVPDDATDALRVLALAGPLGLHDVEASVGAAAVEVLDDAGLVSVRTDGRRELVALAHPLYAEVVGAQIPPLARRRILVAHADRIAGHGARRREDPLRIANARLDATGSADPGLLVAAARLARFGHNHDDVVRLARAALVTMAAPGAPAPLDIRREAVLLLAESLHELGEYEAAESALADAPLGPLDDRVSLQLVSMHVRNLFWGLQRLDDALAVSRGAQNAAPTPATRAEMVVDEAMARCLSGDPRAALTILSGVDRANERVAVLHSVVEVPALLLTGQCETAAAHAATAYRAHLELGDQVALPHPAIHLIHRMQALLDAGRFDDASRLATSAHEVSVRVGAPAGRVWWAYGIGRAALMQGQLRTACRWFTEAAGLSHAHSFGLHRLNQSLLAASLAQLGDETGAAAAAAALAASRPFAHLAGQQQLGPAWAAAVAGDPQRARDQLAAAATAMADSGQAGQAAWLWHEVARLGDAARSRDGFDALGDACEGELVAAYDAHARAAAARSAPGLRETSERFEALGALLFAAEAATEAATAFRRDGNPRAATATLARARDLGDACDGASTPLLRTEIDAPEPLSQREREIAVLAAQRLTSREIAERLHLSVRTVDNHLQRVYVKLGVSGRAELAAALEPS